MPGIGFVGQNLCLAYVMLNKTYSWHMLCWTNSQHSFFSTKPIPAYVMLDKTTYGNKL